jgi:predicted MFS family arabinose efflux permease
MTRVLYVILFSNFFAASTQRITDPVLPQIAADLNVDVQQAALLATAFALPWVVAQPVFGPLGDLIGKSRVIRFNLVLLTLSTFAGAFTTDFTLLFLSRVVAGIATAGVMPVGFALTGDLTPPSERAVSIGRIVGVSMAGQLLGAVAAGFMGDLVGWRGVFIGTAAGVLLAAVGVMIGLRNLTEKRAPSVSFGAVLANYRIVLANPLAKICYGAVFLEGIAMFGIIPYIAPLLVSVGEPRASIAGLVVAGFALGAVVYSALVKLFVRRLLPRQLMWLGAGIAAAGLLTVGFTPPWPVQAAALGALGFGFYMLHNCIQVQMLELAPAARGSAVALHASSFFMGQALGPVIFGLALPLVGALPAAIAFAFVTLAVGIVGARLLFGRPGAA